MLWIAILILLSIVACLDIRKQQVGDAWSGLFWVMFALFGSVSVYACACFIFGILVFAMPYLNSRGFKFGWGDTLIFPVVIAGMYGFGLGVIGWVVVLFVLVVSTFLCQRYLKSAFLPALLVSYLVALLLLYLRANI